MNTNRIALLEKFRLEDPTDPFPIYALALEYQVTESAKARHLFDELLNKHPDYLPTYYMAGNFFLKQNEPERAIKILNLGLNLAKDKKDMNTAREIRGVLDSLE
jgi:tetratricopeptide (TPR) repeat protein